ncbi:MAG: hypothetical protein ACIARR_08515 [Phycisphaerales bacterium JB059]
MRLSEITAKSERTRLLLIWLFLVLVVAAVNVPLALSLTRSRTTPPPEKSLMLNGAEAAAMPWPSAAPHADPWPELHYWQRQWAFGYNHYDARAPGPDPGANSFAMDVTHLGWPLPVIEHKQMWWDWDNAALSGPESDPAPRLLLRGMIGNPLMVGTLVFVLACLVPFSLIVMRRLWRARGGDCPWCGYTLGDGSLCPECGRESTRSAGPPTGRARPPRD